MSVIALCLVVGASLVTFGVAMWAWWALNSVRELQFDFGRFEPRHFDIESTYRRPSLCRAKPARC